ncbi:hypothetical protein [Sporosarcina sp. P17b]|uniref:hypothetical protein n=1 Tax=Sporosarcina sp. P17b TaxID=2048260 RepID=UPI001E285E15|nr:hypothetical protein [Sporosarcina sp. P17b]
MKELVDQNISYHNKNITDIPLKRLGGEVVNKFFWIPLLVSFGTMVVLYVIGFTANIDVLLFNFSLSHTEISLLPIGVGMVMGFISETIIKSKSHAN